MILHHIPSRFIYYRASIFSETGLYYSFDYTILPLDLRSPKLVINLLVNQLSVFRNSLSIYSERERCVCECLNNATVKLSKVFSVSLQVRRFLHEYVMYDFALFALQLLVSLLTLPHALSRKNSQNSFTYNSHSFNIASTKLRYTIYFIVFTLLL